MAKKVTEKDFEVMELSLKEQLAAQPKVKVMIPPDKDNPVWRGFINGYGFAFPKGEVVEVPEALAELIMDTTKAVKMKAELESKLEKGMECSM